MRRRDWLLSSAALGGATLLGASQCSSGSPGNPGSSAGAGRGDWRAPPAQGRHVFSIQVNSRDPGVPVQRSLLGQNLQWVDGGDNLLMADGRWQPDMLDKAIALRPTSLRFPGGAQSDTYHWARGVGPLTARGENLHFHRRQAQPSLMGTQEFLELCEACGAEPLITVNLVTGTPEEAAAWVSATNVSGWVSRRSSRRLPKVPAWEIGNEPYLQEGDKSMWLSPAAYVAKANAFVRAMRAVDPGIRIGLPLRTATIGGVAATPYPSFAADALSGVSERIDFLGLHNAYMPYLFDGITDEQRIYWALMAASATVERNLADTRALVVAKRPGKSLPLAITEYNAFFTTGKGATDDLVASPAGALYVADLLCMLARQPDVCAANYWSLSGNGKFGAIASAGFERPAYRVLQLFEQALKGRRLRFTLETEQFDAPKAGVVPASAGQPLMAALVTRDDDRVCVVLVNKDRSRPAVGRLCVPGVDARRGALSLLASADPMSTRDEPDAMTLTRAPLTLQGDAWPLTLPPASVALVTVAL